MPAGDTAPDALADALLAARLCAIDPGLGGMILRGGGEARDAVIAALREYLPEGAPVRRLPTHIDDERLMGGIDLTATLARGAAVSCTGLLAEAAGGVVIVPLAERMADGLAGRLAAAMDGVDGAARFLLIALDDGMEADERPPEALAERLAFRLDLSAVRNPGSVRAALNDGPSPPPPPLPGMEAACPLSDPAAPILSAITATAVALGVDSARATLFALRAARAAARLHRRVAIADQDVALAARLVLAPRATRMPAAEDAPSAPPPPPSQGEASEQDRGEPDALDDMVLAAALAALPKDVLAGVAAGLRRGPANPVHGAGERRSGARGRPMSAQAGVPGGGLRLSLIDTLRAAAPWQRLRASARCGGGRILIRRDDLRIRRFETRAQVVTIFAVDASGSSALARLAEAKGAVELLLAEAYVKRAEVALIAFRGTSAEVLLPPTRSLTRARRSLAELPGGGGTPLAAGLAAARDLAEQARGRGRTAFLVVLTDGRANIAADGTAVRARAEADALAAAKAIGVAGIAAAFVDISARPRPEGAALATAMRARYLPLPRADAATMHAAVRAAQPG